MFLLLNSFKWLGMLYIISIVGYGHTVLHCGAIHPQTCVHSCVRVCQNEKELIPFDKSELGHLEC